jgi:hypothetical protein
MPNIVGAFDCANAGRHLVLNGHIDVFPVADDGAGWSKDPWGGEYIYRYPGQNNQDGYDLYSYGPDGKLGGDDDITNWSKEK